MDFSSPLPSAGPTVNSPSDMSYSSGASHSSTRTTSPSTSSHRSSPLLDLHHHPATTTIEYTSNTLLDSQPRMDRNAFQSVNMRRDKLVADRVGNNDDATAQFQQPQSMRASAPIGPQAPRSLTSANWRAQATNESIYSPFDSASGGHVHHTGGGRGPTSFPASAHPQMDRQHAGLISYSNVATFSEVQLDASYAYCFDRGNGQYARLIPADMLPPLHHISGVQQGCQGMIVLPQPRALPSNGRSSNTEPVAFRTPPATPTTPADNIQSRIDTIVASTPPTPSHTHTPGYHHAANNSLGSTNSNNSTAGGALNAAPGRDLGPQRRPKIYCDKWVHEGVCAFTQQGCKYKHEMPFDKVTQHQLGLFHGLPAWWKKHQAELARLRDVSGASVGLGVSESGGSAGGNGNADEGLGGGGGGERGGLGGRAKPTVGGGSDTTTNLTWRQRDQGLGIRTADDQDRMGRSLGAGNSGRGQRGNGLCSSVWNPSPFGPIAPPTRATTQFPGSPPCSSSSIPTNNPYASLEALDDSTAEEREDGHHLG
ncbi:hypothetical protein BJ170DRAFT_215456 [Xylariales sp. AK1849]|nr:hypothetical protein BJ170DRAFT_215456 [Xylariales sp. AK1849]